MTNNTLSQIEDQVQNKDHSNDIPEPQSSKNAVESNEEKLKANCYILVGKKANEIRLNQNQVGSKEKTCFDPDLKMWCFYNKEDAEKIANKLSKKFGEIKVREIFSERAGRKWHGTKSEKKSVRLETKYLILKQELEEEEKKIQAACNKQRFDISCLYDTSPPDDFSKKQKEGLGILKPQFDEWKKKKDECDELEKELSDLEEQIKQEKNEKSRAQTNPQDWPFRVLGYNNKREILLWHEGDLMLIPVKQMGKKDLQLLMGSSICENIESLIINEASRKGKIYDDKPIKAGLWKIRNKWLVISGKRAATIDENGVFKDLDEPIFEGKIIEFENSEWLDWNHFKISFGKVKLEDVYNKLLPIISAWNWLESSMAQYATAFVLLSPLQQAMSWRPWLYLTGAKGTGKSTFFESILQEIYGAMAERLDKTTAHATAQTIGNTGKIPIFDEFEKYGHLSHVLELAKTFNKGGKKTSGTPGPNAHKYDLHHLAWFGSIYAPKQISNDSAQESRIIKMELKKLKNTTPLLEKIEDGSKFAAEIIASMISKWKLIEQEAKSISQRRKEIMEQKPGTEIRTVDNFMYASAILNLATKETNKETYDVPDWKTSSSEDDGEKVLLAILHSRIKNESNEYRMISELVKLAERDDQIARRLLQQNGLSISTSKGETYLAIRTQLVSKFLLNDDEYFKNLDISSPLGRIEGAEKNVGVKFGNQGLLKSITIPMHYINFICGFDQPTKSKTDENGNGGNCQVTHQVTTYSINNKKDKYNSYHGYQENDNEIENELSLFDEKK